METANCEYLLLDKTICLAEGEILLHKPAWSSENKSGSKKLLFRHQLQLFCSFLCGFLMAYMTLIFYDPYLVWSVQIEQHATNTEYYESGYMSALKDIEIEETDLHNHLEKSVRVLCMVLTCPKYHQERAIHIKKTWGSRCTKLLFMSSENDENLNSIAIVEAAEDVYDKLWNKTRESFRYAYENHINEYDWFVKADDDTYIIMENLRYMLYAYKPDIPLYFGYEMKIDSVNYMSGGASYVLSREALKLFMEESFDNKTLCADGAAAGIEDFTISSCLQNAGVLMVNSKSATEEDQKTKFFPLPIIDYFEPQYNKTIPEWLYNMSTDSVELGLDCCSNYSVAFHYINPAGMYALEFLIYHMQAFSLRRPIGKLPTKISEQILYDKFKKNISLPIIL